MPMVTTILQNCVQHSLVPYAMLFFAGKLSNGPWYSVGNY